MICHRRLESLYVFLSATRDVASGSACATGLKAISPGTFFNVSCPVVAGARYLTLFRNISTSKSLSVSELRIFSNSQGIRVTSILCFVFMWDPRTVGCPHQGWHSALHSAQQ